MGFTRASRTQNLIGAMQNLMKQKNDSLVTLNHKVKWLCLAE